MTHKTQTGQATKKINHHQHINIHVVLRVRWRESLHVTGMMMKRKKREVARARVLFYFSVPKQRSDNLDNVVENGLVLDAPTPHFLDVERKKCWA